MTTAPQIHLHLGDTFTGELHVHLAGSTATTSFVNGTTVATESPSLSEITSTEITMTKAISEIMQRFTKYDSSSPAQEMYNAMIEAGWTPHAPAVRVDNKPPEAYIRWVWSQPGGSKPPSLYQGSRSIGTGKGAKHSFHADYSTLGVADVISKIKAFMDGIL
jgi:hypothetical protein